MKVKSCPRVRYNGTSPRRFRVAKDPAVREIARMVAAGVDEKFSAHPRYAEMVREYGKEKAWELIRSMTARRGAVDLIQNTLRVDELCEGRSLFGGLSVDGTRFVFYEWGTGYTRAEDTDCYIPQMCAEITAHDARAIVAGKKKTVLFTWDPRGKAPLGMRSKRIITVRR